MGLCRRHARDVRAVRRQRGFRAQVPAHLRGDRRLGSCQIRLPAPHTQQHLAYCLPRPHHYQIPHGKNPSNFPLTTTYVHIIDTCCSVSARQLDSESKVMDSRRTELDVPAEMGSQTSEHFRWNVWTVSFQSLIFRFPERFVKFVLNFCREYYIISAQWVGKDNAHVGVVWMNRAQNLTVYSSCYAPNWTCTEVRVCFNFYLSSSFRSF